MARGRMFDRAFMKSRKVQGMPRDDRLVYASILPFLDREGRIIAEPLYLKANVFRHSDFTIEEIATAIRTIAAAGLADLYADEDNDAIIQYTRFQDFNTPNSKEAKSDLPGPGDEGAMPCRDPLINNAQAMHVQCTGNASGERNGSRTEVRTEEETPPTPPAPEPQSLAGTGDLPNPDECNNDNALIWWTHYQQHPTGNAIAAHVTRTQLRTRWGPHEAVRLAKLHTPEFVTAAYDQAVRDAQHNVERTFVLILEGAIAPDRRAQPRRKSDARPQTTTHPTHGTVPVIGRVGSEFIVELPDGTSDRVSIAA